MTSNSSPRQISNVVLPGLNSPPHRSHRSSVSFIFSPFEETSVVRSGTGLPVELHRDSENAHGFRMLSCQTFDFLKYCCSVVALSTLLTYSRWHVFNDCSLALPAVIDCHGFLNQGAVAVFAESCEPFA